MIQRKRFVLKLIIISLAILSAKLETTKIDGKVTVENGFKKEIDIKTFPISIEKKSKFQHFLVKKNFD